MTVKEPQDRKHHHHHYLYNRRTFENKVRIPLAFVVIALTVLPFIWLLEESVVSSYNEANYTRHIDESPDWWGAWKKSSSSSGALENLVKQSHPAVVVVSADGRRPRFGSKAEAAVSPETATFYDWAALMNLAYAERHGYDYIYFSYGDNGGEVCSHPLFGKRYVAWCKLLSMEKVLSNTLNYKQNESSPVYLLWLDSDAAWVRQDVPVSSFLSNVGLGCFPNTYKKENEPENGTPPEHIKGCQTSICQRIKETASLLFFANRPFCGASVMSGTFLLQASQQARRILSQWWNLNICADEFPWEQRAANTALYPNLAGQGVEVLSTSHNYYPSTSDTVLHLGHFNKGGDPARAQGMRDAFRQIAGLDETADFDPLAARMTSHIIELKSEELKLIAKELSAITWEKNSNEPDVSWMTKYNYSSSPEKWSTCDYLSFKRPPYIFS